MSGSRNGYLVVEKLLKQRQARLKQTQVTAIRAVNALAPACGECDVAQIDHPEVSQTSSNKQASQAFRIS